MSMLTPYKVERNPVTGALDHYFVDEKEGKVEIVTKWDCKAAIEANKRQALNTIDGRKFGGRNDMYHVARIPNGVAVKLMKEYGINVHGAMSPEDERRLWRILDDPEWKYLKTINARLGTKGIRY